MADAIDTRRKGFEEIKDLIKNLEAKGTSPEGILMQIKRKIDPSKYKHKEIT